MTTIKLEEYTREDFIEISQEGSNVSMTVFKNRFPIGQPGWATNVTLTPEQAKEIGEALIAEAGRLEE